MAQQAGHKQPNDIIRIQCPSCGTGYRLRASAVSTFPTTTKCKKCNHRIRIDDPAQINTPSQASAKPEPHPLAKDMKPEIKKSISPQIHRKTQEAAEADTLHAFIGRNVSHYLHKFRSFTKEGTPAFKATWHWPAFLISPVWFLYRKLYMWALLSFVLSFIPLVSLASKIIWGICANYLYYKHTHRKIEDLKIQHAQSTTDDFTHVLQKKGGVHRWAAWSIPSVAVIGIIAAIAIPQFASYRNRAYDSRARLAVEQVMEAQWAYYEHNQRYADSIELLENHFQGVQMTSPLQVTIHNADAEDYLVEAFHPQGNHRYTGTSMDPQIAVLPMDSLDLFGPRRWCKITVPDDWRQMKELNSDADIRVGHPVKDSYAIVFVEDKTDFYGVDLESFSELTRTGIEDNLLDSETTATNVERISGCKAVQYKITGKLPDTRVEVVYLHTIVQGRRGYYQILAWTSEINYDANKHALRNVARRFTEL